ncbi:hypothetical protein OF897_18420 [Chryseobacterium formosus]|uniref:Site-specific DNA-methyltransferase (cytosine-N(4)-specific) n=1 Tax=Chryseobacterium formosus TaxID=1537363 RepID=A0ABT3XW91_9FLAO|nr:hypothetical protein [Chryseobacterium formosus]MCX8525893.1 hypothetical protein [Chryseobacterium formosus]
MLDYNLKERVDSNIISNASGYNNEHRFRWYPYKEGFSKSLVQEAINSIKLDENDYILDPFNGNGTVTLTSSLNNISSLGIESNPFSAFLAKTKSVNLSTKELDKDFNKLLKSIKNGKKSKLLEYSTFSEYSGKKKWLFNSEVLNAFEGGWQYTDRIYDINKKKLLQLSLISSAIDNCNAVKDGKCLKYKQERINKNFSAESFLNSFEGKINLIREDLQESIISTKPSIINGDSRIILDSIPHYKLCITSPPYLNSFDYTDIYRPELFLGKFIKSSEELKNLRYNTIRSHKLIYSNQIPDNILLGQLFEAVINSLPVIKKGWNKTIPHMIKGYFEDMSIILSKLFATAKKGGELWIVIANSVYLNTEIPVDLILAEIGSLHGWKLKKIEVLRYIYRRKTKYSGDHTKLRESLIVFEK